MKKGLFFIILFGLLISTVSADYSFNGANGVGTGISSSGRNGSCEVSDSTTQCNQMNNIGLRLTVVDYRNNSYTALSDSLDIWLSSSFNASPYYIGSSKISSNTTIKSGDKYSYATVSSINESFGVNIRFVVEDGAATKTYDSPLADDDGKTKKSHFYRDLSTVFTPKVWNCLLGNSEECPENAGKSIFTSKIDGQPLTYDRIKEYAKTHESISSQKCKTNSNECYGIRILVEPIFEYYIHASSSSNNGYYVLTPSEYGRLQRIGNAPFNSDLSWDFHYGFQTAGYLWTTFTDIGIKSGATAHSIVSNPNEVSKADYKEYFKGLLTSNENIGFALNIFDIEGITNKNSCQLAVEYSQENSIFPKKLSNYTKDELRELLLNNKDIIVYKDDKGIVRNLKWYTDVCSCVGIEDYYTEFSSGNKLPELKKSKIEAIFSSTSLLTRFTFKMKELYGENSDAVDWNYNTYINQCYYNGSNKYNCNDLIDSNSKYDLRNKYKDEILSLNNNYFKEYNNKYSTDWTPQLYVEYCPYKAKVNCDPNFETISKGNNASCYVGQLSYSDSSNWNECIFNDNGEYTVEDGGHKNSNKISDLTYYDSSLGSKYCPVYCTETFQSELTNPAVGYGFSQDSVLNIKAGQNFIWSGNSVSGSRTCKTSTINYALFQSELTTTNATIRSSYINWKLEELKEKAYSKANQSSTLDCGYVCDAYEQVKCNCDEKGENCGTCDGKCIDGHYTDYTYSINEKSVSFMGKTEGLRTNWCGASARPTTDVSGKKNIYDTNVDQANKIITDMKACYTKKVWDEKLYNVNPIVNVNYTNTVINPKGNQVPYQYSGPMDKETIYTNIDSSSDCTSVVEHLMTCSDSTCKEVEIDDMYKCGVVIMSKSATTTFKINDNVYRYVMKENGKSFHETDLSNLKNSYSNLGITLNYIDIGHGNFPVAYATKPGLYGYNSNQGRLSLTYSNFGHIKNSGQTEIDKLLSSLGDNYGEYECSYYVNKGIIDIDDEDKNSGSVDVIYRPIDLKDPFPSIDGDGRVTGANWCDWKNNDCSRNNQTVQSVILNNRGVESDEVYNKEPMYSFKLTPSIIKTIRKYNKEYAYDSYSNGEYDFVCDSESKHCISEYLTELIELTEATGSCTTNRVDNFDVCR